MAEEITEENKKRIDEVWSYNENSRYNIIDINSQFEAEVTLESGVSILGDSKIVNSHIKSNSIVESSIVKDSEVGPIG